MITRYLVLPTLVVFALGLGAGWMLLRRERGTPAPAGEGFSLRSPAPVSAEPSFTYDPHSHQLLLAWPHGIVVSSGGPPAEGPDEHSDWLCAHSTAYFRSHGACLNLVKRTRGPVSYEHSLYVDSAGNLREVP